ncbi:DUF2730 family protein [Shewanella avicenniae]|uniref:DUF2730 family protein n=1 Tax=Shewanella avicenniae TaxID=2814294 RepID=A0ABX7QMD0_9GAMM|nr:DUF2730 family protein [Shewanella avicenniae]QSX32609.1 DUF2730 family protein [Shewanella avicenniae]
MLEVLFKVWPIVATIGSVLGTLGMAWLSRKFVPMAEHSKVVEMVDAHETRLNQVEQHLDAMPTREELHALDKMLTGLGERLGGMERGINRLENKTDMLLENELREKRRGDD